MSDEDEVGELLQRGAGDHPAAPPVGTLMRRGRRRRRFRRVGTVATVAVVVLAGAAAVAGLDEFRVEFSPADTDESDESSSGSVLARPDPGETSAEWLVDGRPVFVVAHEDESVSVVDAVSTHRAYRPDKLVGWCDSARIFQDPHHYSHWGPRGQYLGGPAPAGLATYAAEVDGDEVHVGARRPPASRETDSSTDPTGPPCGWPEDTTGPARLDGHGVRHTPEAAPWPTTTATQAAKRDGPAVVEATAIYDGDGAGRLCSDPEPGPPPRCPPDSPPLAGEQPRLRDSAHTGTYLAITDDGEVAFLAGFGDLTSDFFGPRPTSPNPPPGRPSPRVSLEDDTLQIPAVDIDYANPPDEATPAGSYKLRLDNRGNLPHTLVNDDLGIDLAAEPGQQATTTVDLPAGEHVFYCRIGNHRQAGMELHLTVN